MGIDSVSMQHYMERCFELAKQAPRGMRRPYVGALVLSKSGKLIGEGYKQFMTGTAFLVHAERAALYNAEEAARDGTLFTTLEPCVKLRESQILKSCAEFIVERGITTVIFGVVDGSDSMQPMSGIDYLRKRKVRVIEYKEMNDRIISELMPRGK